MCVVGVFRIAEGDPAHGTSAGQAKYGNCRPERRQGSQFVFKNSIKKLIKLFKCVIGFCNNCIRGGAFLCQTPVKCIFI